MKKLILTWLVLVFVSTSTFSQTQNNEWEPLAPFIADKCISLLGNSVPNNFTKINSTTYMDEVRGIVVYIKNNLISSSSVVAPFSNISEMSRFFMAFYRFFDNKWEPVSERDGDYVFVKDGVYALLNASPVRQGAQLVSTVWFSKTMP